MESGSKGQLFLHPQDENCMVGSIQPFQTGWLLDDWLELEDTEQIKINKVHLNNAVLTAIVFGMFDTHGSNIIITKEGQIKYFDNSKSLPNSNAFIKVSDDAIYPAFRLALLDLPECYVKFTDNEKESLKEQIECLNEKFKNLEIFIDSSYFKKLYGGLPLEWLKKETAFQAMKDRINLMKEAISRNDVDNLINLASNSLPAYKFAIGLECCRQLEENEDVFEKLGKDEVVSKISKFLNSDNGYYSVEKIIKNLNFNFIDLDELLDCSDQPEVKFENIPGICYDLFFSTIKTIDQLDLEKIKYKKLLKSKLTLLDINENEILKLKGIVASYIEKRDYLLIDFVENESQEIKNKEEIEKYERLIIKNESFMQNLIGEVGVMKAEIRDIEIKLKKGKENRRKLEANSDRTADRITKYLLEKCQIDSKS